MKQSTGRSVAIITAGVLVAITLVIVGLRSGGERLDVGVRTRPSVPLVVRGVGQQPAMPTLGPAERSAARRTAVKFVRSYLPVLYGQARAQDVASATVHLRRSLREVRQPPRAVRRRHPRLQDLELTAQTRRSMVARATIRDGVAPPFGVIFTIERRGRAWIVSDLASD